MASAPILGGVTLPLPAKYEEAWFQRGTARRMADGSIRWDYISVTMKRKFRISWLNISSANRTTVLSAINTAITGIGVSYTSPEGSSYTVRLTESDLSDWELKTAAANQLNLYSGEIALEEV